MQQPRKIWEYQRTCQACGKVWHSLAVREMQIQKNARSNSCSEATQGCGCNPGAQLQARRNKEANQGELAALKSCPQCGSGFYDEQLLEYVDNRQQTLR